MANAVGSIAGIPSISAFAREVPGINSEAIRGDFIDFQTAITAAGVITPAFVQARVPSDYYFAIHGIRGYYQYAGATGAAAYVDNSGIAMISATFREAGTARDMFTSPVNLGMLVGANGLPSMEFTTRYVAKPGAELRATFALGANWVAATFPAIAGNGRIVGFVLVGDLVHA